MFAHLYSHIKMLTVPALSPRVVPSHVYLWGKSVEYSARTAPAFYETQAYINSSLEERYLALISQELDLLRCHRYSYCAGRTKHRLNASSKHIYELFL